eukprot:GHVQ01014076.1.p1 GENE.GHVQ01014076.1~~GHVQ01014076.1.p1  ORF type:complete len:637 (-),score=88.49 GHVQ01014076.1:971-2881(-)
MSPIRTTGPALDTPPSPHKRQPPPPHLRNNMTQSNHPPTSPTHQAMGGGGGPAPLHFRQTASESKEASSVRFLQVLREQIGRNLAATTGNECPMTKKDAFDYGQLQYQAEFQDAIMHYGINVKRVFHNECPAMLYEQALHYEPETYITSTGALAVSSGIKTGRSPSDKRIVDEASSRDHIWWGKINMKMTEKSYLTNRERALDYLNLQEQLFVVDAYAGWDAKYRIKIRVIATRAYHALFMQNMLVMPTEDELHDFKPEFIIYNAGCFPANRYTECVSSQTSVAVNFGRGEMVILGTQYAGEMKKGILTLIMYQMPRQGQLPLHSSCNVGKQGDVTLFFGLSGTGKTTLSADPDRELIGDDEHVWTETGVFNVEGGCYAKCKDLSREQEPEIFDALRFGSVLENVVLDGTTRVVDYADCSITENTRAAYPLCHISNARIPALVDTHPSNIVLLTCDAFGVLPPVSKLTPEQVMYHFVSGYTSKVAGTEEGITEPIATFSACFGAPFLALHPTVYAEMLAKKMKAHTADAWLLNTGWINGAYGTGKRIPLKYTRKMVDAIHDGTLAKAPFETSPVFNLAVPKSIEGVPSEVLMPYRSWPDGAAFETSQNKLAGLFKENFKYYEDKSTADIRNAGPQL